MLRGDPSSFSSFVKGREDACKGHCLRSCCSDETEEQYRKYVFGYSQMRVILDMQEKKHAEQLIEGRQDAHNDIPLRSRLANETEDQYRCYAIGYSECRAIKDINENRKSNTSKWPSYAEDTYNHFYDNKDLLNPES
jgi:hypothetical protein